VPVAAGTVGSADATCPAGTTVVGTGFDASIGNVGFAERFGNFVGVAVFNDTTITITIEAQAICGGGPGVTAAAARRTTAQKNGAGVAKFNDEVAALEAAVAEEKRAG
jgi:hypothetical protein